MKPKTITRESLREAIASNPRLSSFPKIAVPIITMFNNPNTTFRDLANVIEEDPELSARVLKIVNSGYYGFKRRIKSVTHAVVLLGWNAVKMITLGSTIISKMQEMNRRLFDHSMHTAQIARFIAMDAGFYKVEEIAVVGLLHDIGSFIIESYFPQEHSRVKQYRIDNGVPLHVAEQELLGIDHGIVGGWTLEDWDLPRNISSSVMWHHNFKARTYHSKKTAVLHVADVLAIAVDVNGPEWEKVPELKIAALRTLGIEHIALRDIILTIMKMNIDPLIF